MATTRTVSTVNELVSVEQLGYIKAINVRVDVEGVRPNTKLYAFFGTENINGYCRQIADTSKPVAAYVNLNDAPTVTSSYSALNSVGTLTSDSTGRVSFYFFIPPGKFNTGNKELVVADTSNLADLQITGNVYGSASAVFESNGVLQYWQKTTTTTTVNTIEQTITTYAGDPLAQSFFTYGATGGIFITKIQTYFQSKDDTLPVILELRKLDNGYPMPFDKTRPELRVTLNPSDVSVSNDGSIPTSFVFSYPIYIPQDGDYCFVLLSMSPKYNVWTSKLGEKSIENGAIIFKQPYVGSLFKSENDITWSADQFEDIKFTMYKAAFYQNTTGVLKMRPKMRYTLTPGENFYTVSGSNKVQFRTTHQHGLKVNSKIDIYGYDGATYNGIDNTNINGVRTVTTIYDEYTAEFQAGAAATSTGKILTSGTVHSITIINGGSGYTSKPTITIAAPTSGTTATVSASDITIVDGVITNIKVTNVGSGYTAPPSVTVSGGGGTGLEIVPIIDAYFAVMTNKKVHKIAPTFKHFVADSTSITAKFSGLDTNYNVQDDVAFSVSGVSNLGKTYLIASTANEDALLGGNDSSTVTLELSTTNPNVSPVIDLRRNPGILATNFGLNNQTTLETVDQSTTAAYSTVSTISVVSGGSGYTITPTVTITAAPDDKNRDKITPATAHAVLTADAVTSIVVDTAGSGYTKRPFVTISDPVTGTTATATANMTAFNSELATSGTAYSRYLTNVIRLKTPSTGLRVLVDAFSTPLTNIDWYVRTSLSSDSSDHEANGWKLMKCDVPRNKSSLFGSPNSFYEYEFYLEGLSDFDTYDMKAVFRSADESITPYVSRYRVIVYV